jgi:hypothetical protein
MYLNDLVPESGWNTLRTEVLRRMLDMTLIP